MNPSAYGKGRFYIEIDGVEVGHADCGTSTVFRTALMETELAAGEHTLVIRHSNELSTDGEKRSNSVIDGISITPKADLLFNGGFEGYIGVIPSNHSIVADGSHNADGWIGTSDGLSEAGSPLLEGGRGSPFEGSTAIHFNGAKEISQDVEIPVAGAYEISFAYAPRNLVHYAGGRVNVWIDDVKVGYVDCDATTMKFRRYVVRTQIAAGSHVFKLTHTLDNPVNPNNTPCSAIDDVSLRPVDNLIMNGSFDLGTVDNSKNSGGNWETWSQGGGYSNPGWVSSGSCGLAKPGYPSSASWASTNLSPTGVYSLFMQTANYTYNWTTRIIDAASTSQSFDVAASGVYELRFSYASRPYNHYKGGMIYARVYKGEGLEGELIWERSVTANSLTSFEQFVENVKFSKPGKFTLQFYAPQPEYSETAENNRGVVVDNVSLCFLRKFKGLVIVVH